MLTVRKLFWAVTDISLEFILDSITLVCLIGSTRGCDSSSCKQQNQDKTQLPARWVVPWVGRCVVLL
jgi:hypothetical protein